MKPEHCFWNTKTGELKCDHCGDTYPMALPVSLGMALAISKQFSKEHRRCPKPKVDVPKRDEKPRL